MVDLGLNLIINLANLGNRPINDALEHVGIDSSFNSVDNFRNEKKQVKEIPFITLKKKHQLPITAI